ncbi:triacylglycerol lipase-like protein [Apiospora kogelbergensis]|uniref:triacylglycerol lipase-like protein n=1 Tax=Apiospora kogelbergensis TaxID=1337665 RepID=UPI00312FDBEA
MGELAGAGDGNDEQSPILTRTLNKVKRGFRKWHAYAIAAVVLVVVIVLVAVLVPVLLHQRDEKTRDEQQKTPSDISKARVNLGYAQYQGSHLPNGVNQFLGIRFAAPPTGDLRWKAPAEPQVRSGDQPADKFGKICLGISQPLPNDFQAEDCLFANIWAPSNATTNSKLPVWLFIQGGGYTVNANANWNGSDVVERSGGSLVLVNFNYRVGLWGFLAGEQVRADGDLNAGLLDQRMMMKWVKKHIDQFGGDPDQVIIHGGSAGAGSVALHLIANGGVDEHLFHGGIGESLFFPSQPYVSELEWQFSKVLNDTKCQDSASPMKCLRGKDARELQAANFPSPFPGRTDVPLPLFYWTPCIDGQLLQDRPYKMFEDGKFIDVPIIFGNDNDEGTVFAPNTGSPQEIQTFLQNNYRFLEDEEAKSITELYPRMEEALPNHNVWFSSAQMAYGETTFICPAVYLLSAYAQQRGNATTNTTTGAWGYRYNVADAVNAALGIGVPHLFESFAIFGPDNVPGAPESYYTYNAPMVPLVMDYWISFVRALDPNPFRSPDAPSWEQWGAGKRRLLLETGKTAMESTPQEQRARCDAWKELAPVMRQKR